MYTASLWLANGHIYDLGVWVDEESHLRPANSEEEARSVASKWVGKKFREVPGTHAHDHRDEVVAELRSIYLDTSGGGFL